MKTFVIKTEEDICKILGNNNIKHLNNSFEIIFKDVKQYSKKQNKIGMDLIMFDTHMVPLRIQKSNSLIALFRGDSKSYIVSFVNIKNDKGEYFSSLVENLSKNDRILITNGVVLKNALTFNNNRLTIAVRPENHSSVFLFKYKSSYIENPSLTLVKNLSKITGSGTYSLFGNITRIIKYTDEKLMLLRIQCFDKCSIKTRKYPQFVHEFKNISKEETISGIKYDCSSNTIDILVKKPCQSFITLTLNQRIYLNNVKVNYSSDLELFLLHVKGKIENLKADPIETNSVNSLRPPIKYFPIPNELKPAIRLKTKQISCNIQVNSNDQLQRLNKIEPESPLKNVQIDLNDKFERLNKIEPEPPLKNLSLSTKKHGDQIVDLSCSSSDDNINLSPCRDFLLSKDIFNKDNNINKCDSGSFCKKRIKNYNDDNINNCSPSKILSISNSRTVVPKRNNSSSIKRKTILKKENSSDSTTDGSCSPPFFKTSEVQQEETFNQRTQLKKLDLSLEKSTQCLGPCRLIHIENPNNIVYGYCTTCFAFFPKHILIKSNIKNYECPKCSNIVNLTFFFKMNFLYGKYERQAIEVCCYNDNAKRVIKKLLKKNITLEDYLFNHDIRKLFIDTTKSLINDKTKVNIIVTPKDNTYLLLGIDTKYVVTIPLD